MGADEARALIKKRVRVLRSHVAAARTGDVEGIHDLRVASRRLRAALGENGDLIGRAVRGPFRSDVSNVTRLLGKARELDVSIGLLKDLSEGSDNLPEPAVGFVLRHLTALRESETAAVAEGADSVESPDFNAALVSVLEHIEPSPQCYLKAARKRLRKRYGRLVAAHHQWTRDPCEEALHQIRIGFKKFRYGCELYSGLYGAPMKGLLKQLKAAQESLGDWNDHRVLRNYIQILSAAEAGSPGHGNVPAEGLSELCAVVDAKAAALLKAFSDSSGRFFSAAKVAEIEALLKKTKRACCKFTS
jgi:CHAD domain-containing protein